MNDNRRSTLCHHVAIPVTPCHRLPGLFFFRYLSGAFGPPAP